MRKIEQEMVSAVNNMRSMSKNNTSVVYSPTGHSSKVYLHGNHLGTYYYNRRTFVVNLDTLAKYPTRTTTSRLRALDVNVNIKAGVPYINGIEV